MKYSLFISAIVLFFCSCSNDSEKKLQVYKSTIKSIEKSSEKINRTTIDLRKELLARLNDFRYSNRANEWYPVSVKISDLSTSLISYVNGLKLQLIKECANRDIEEGVFKANYFRSVDKVFFQQNEGRKLFDSLKIFIDSIKKFSIDMGNEITKRLNTADNYLNYETKNSKEFVNTFFYNVSAASALCSLAKIENDITNFENEMIVYCYNMTSPGCILRYERFQAIVGQSSNCVKAGDEIEIYAGVGAFSTAAQPKILVDNKTLSCNDDGLMVYKFKSALKAGQFSKPVYIEYYKPDGTKESRHYNIQYTVINPNQ